MPLDNITGYSITKQDPKDYSVIFTASGKLIGKDGLTLTEAISQRDTYTSGCAIIVRTAGIINRCYQSC